MDIWAVPGTFFQLFCVFEKVFNVRINTLKWRMQVSVVWVENNCDLLPLLLQGYFAYLLQNPIKTRHRSLCNVADLSNSKESFHPPGLICITWILWANFLTTVTILSPPRGCSSQRCVFLSAECVEQLGNGCFHDLLIWRTKNRRAEGDWDLAVRKDWEFTK